MTESGKVLQTVKAAAKHRMMCYFERRRCEVEAGNLPYEALEQSAESMLAHLEHGQAWHFAKRLRRKVWPC